MKRKNDLSKSSKQKLIFFKRLKYAERKRSCICKDVYKMHEVRISIKYLKLCPN